MELDLHGYNSNAAIIQLEKMISLAKKNKSKILKVIVGYGSTGKTHKIKDNAIDFLNEIKNKNIIKDFICGEELDIFCKKYQDFKYKELISETEKKIRNKGIIIVVL